MKSKRGSANLQPSRKLPFDVEGSADLTVTHRKQAPGGEPQDRESVVGTPKLDSVEHYRDCRLQEISL